MGFKQEDGGGVVDGVLAEYDDDPLNTGLKQLAETVQKNREVGVRNITHSQSK